MSCMFVRNFEAIGHGTRNFFFYHGFADLLRHILCPNLEFRTPLSILIDPLYLQATWYNGTGKVRLDFSLW